MIDNEGSRTIQLKWGDATLSTINVRPRTKFRNGDRFRPKMTCWRTKTFSLANRCASVPRYFLHVKN
ncbi:MAG TPA: hypothetical protein VFO36_06520, partial [Nitrospiraceae bacterium]|nr:hypothetical protein [Nitrospiraceae bacterium]